MVDNTNITVPEYLNYVGDAEGHRVHILNFEVHDRDEALRLAQRSVHGVPPDVVSRRFDAYIMRQWPPIPFENVAPIENTWDNDLDVDVDNADADDDGEDWRDY